MTFSNARAAAANSPPQDLDALRSEISARYNDLSNRLQRFSRYLLDHPTEIALETVTVLAERANVQPSSLVRFAQTFGYSGFSEMQRIFQAPLAASSPSYAERMRSFESKRGVAFIGHPKAIVRQACSVNTIALENLGNTIDKDRLEEAVHLLTRARQIYVVGHEQCFPVAAYLAFALPHFDRPTHLITGLGGMLQQQTRAMTPRDVLIAVGFEPYSVETISVVTVATTRKIPVVAISDSPVSPLSQAGVFLEIRDADLRGIRSLTASLCLAQSLALAIAAEQDG